MIRPGHEVVIAGLSCGQVLAALSDYLDGDLPPAARAQVEDHLRGCERCARFGGELRATVRALRARLTAARPVPPAVLARLRLALDEEA